MKFSVVTATVFTLFAVSRAIPVSSFGSIDDLVERSIYDELDARDFDFDLLDSRELDDVLDARDLEFMELEARVGAFNTGLSTSGKNKAKDFVNDANQSGKLANAAAPGNSAKTAHADNTFHLDRQQPTNSDGQRKVAVQLNKVNKGDPSTVGQVAIHGNADPSSNKVAKKLEHSINTGKETHINHPDSKAAKNRADNDKKSEAKTARIEAGRKAGEAKAASGQFKKGNKRSE